jgi:hypothetical protein
MSYSPKIQPHLPTDTPGKPRVDDRRVISDEVKAARPTAIVPNVYRSED